MKYGISFPTPDAVVSAYDTDATEYANRTRNLPMWSELQRFSKLLPVGGSIVDAGCGSGRDSKWFSENGFIVYAYDGSERMASEAKTFLGDLADVSAHMHSEIAQQLPESSAHGIWASASLLFLDDQDLSIALKAFERILTDGGMIYASFKNGSEEGDCAWRNLSTSHSAWLSNLSGLRVVDSWSSVDTQGRPVPWTSFILEKSKKQ